MLDAGFGSIFQLPKGEGSHSDGKLKPTPMPKLIILLKKKFQILFAKLKFLMIHCKFHNLNFCNIG